MALPWRVLARANTIMRRKGREQSKDPTPILTRFLTDLKHILGPTALKRVVRQLLAHDALALAGQLAYFFILFLFPFLIFVVSLVGLVVDNPESILKAVVTSTKGFLPQAAIEILNGYLDRTLRSTSSFIFLISCLLTLLMGAAATESIIRAANRAYEVPETRPFWERWFIDFVLILGFTLLFATMAFMVLSPHTGTYLQGLMGLPGVFLHFWGVLSWTVVLLNLTLAFDILYYLAPNAHLPFRWITPGGFMTIILLLISNKIFIFWASNVFRPDQLFGQLAIGIVLLLWLFVVGLVVLAGIEINAQLARMAEEHKGTQIIEPPKEGP
jgi:membrane protein